MVRFPWKAAAGDSGSSRRKFLFALGFLLVFVAIYLLPSSEGREGPARGGRIAWEGGSSPYISLSGEWEELDGELTLDGWEGAGIGVLPKAWKERPYGFASYRLRVSGLSPGSAYGILAPYQATAYALYVDGELASSNGRVGRSGEDSAPGYLPEVLSFTAEGAEAELILQVSNFHHRRGGPFQTILFGDPDSVGRIDVGRALADGLLASLYLLMGLYQFSFFLVRRERGVAYLALFLLFAEMNCVAGTREVLLLRLFPDFSWYFFQKLCYFAAYGAPLWLFLFAHRLYGGLSRGQVAALAAPFPAIFLLVALTPPRTFTTLNNIFQLYAVFTLGMVFAMIAAAVKAKVRGAGIVLTGFLLLGAAAASAIFFSNDRIEGGAILPLGFLEYYRITFFDRFSLSLTSLSYLATLAFVGIFCLSYFFRHPSVLRGAAAEAPGPLDVEEAAARLGLSAREAEIAAAMLEGKSNKEIAIDLRISLSTVKTHASRIFRKTGVDSRSGLFRRMSAGAAPDRPREKPQPSAEFDT